MRRCHAAATCRPQPAINDTLFVRHNHDVVAAAIVLGNHVGHGRCQGGGIRRQLFTKIETQGVIFGRSTALLLLGPLIYVIATADNTEMTSHIGTFGVFWRQRSEEHTSELQSLMRISYAVFCLKKKKK